MEQEKDPMTGYLTISNSKELYRLPTDNIIYVAGGRNYSDIMMADQHTRVVTLQLGQIEEMLKRQLGNNGKHLVRIGKSLIINLNYLTYINPAKGQLILGDCRQLEFKLEASKEALTQLKLYYENQLQSLEKETSNK